MIDTASRAAAQDLLNFIDISPSPWHVAANAASLLQAAGFQPLSETASWQLQPGGRYYVIRDESSLIAFHIGSQPLAESGYRIVGAHTDSPGLRVKPVGTVSGEEPMIRLGVEVYGGPILATFTDRDLSLAGRVSLKTADGSRIESRLVHFAEPLVRLPNLAIHMNRTVNTDGLKLHKTKELPLILAALGEELPAEETFVKLLAEQLEVEPAAILAWELAVFDTQPGAFYGPNREFIASGQLDNLGSCHAALRALTDKSRAPEACSVVALFDHEEIGSESAKGADGSFLPDVLERIALALSIDRESQLQALANSFLISADMAHAYQPNYAEAYDSAHQVKINGGPVIKVNANQRYTSESISQAMFQQLCAAVEVPVQRYVHRTDIACGSTIGPMTSARLGIRAVDVGNPMWSMHSARESAGAKDHLSMIRVLDRFFGPDSV